MEEPIEPQPIHKIHAKILKDPEPGVPAPQALGAVFGLVLVGLTPGAEWLAWLGGDAFHNEWEALGGLAFFGGVPLPGPSAARLVVVEIAWRARPTGDSSPRLGCAAGRCPCRAWQQLRAGPGSHDRRGRWSPRPRGSRLSRMGPSGSRPGATAMRACRVSRAPTPLRT